MSSLITLQNRHAGMPFLSVFADRADGSNPTAPVYSILKDALKSLENQGLLPIGTNNEPRGNRYGATKKADILFTIM